MKTLFILDASGYIYRSYFAIRNITNSKGESTNALFGFLRSLQKLIKDFHPEHLVAVFDGPSSGKHRKELHPEYKAHRAATPQDLIYQIGWAQEACALSGIPYLSVPNVEADDTMGSIAHWAAKHDAHVYLCTSDKDLYQFVNDKIEILNTFKDNLIMGPKEVEEAFGVPPEQMIDLLAIMGDTSDNVPGVPGLGPKTAAALLKEFGSLDNLLKHPEKVSGKKQELLIQYADQARLSKRLVTIPTDVEFPKDKTFFHIQEANVPALKAFYASMNFNSLIRELEQLTPSKGTQQAIETPEPTDYVCVDDEKSFHELLKHLHASKEIAIAALGTDPLPMRAECIGIAFSTTPFKGWYVPLNGNLNSQMALKALRELFQNPKISFFGHNIKSDIQALAKLDITIAHVSFDTMLASYILNSHSRQHTLDHLMLEIFGRVKSSCETLTGKGKKAIPIENVPPKHVAPCLCETADYTCRLKNILEEQLKERKLYPLLKDLELPLLTVLAQMERHGIYVDIPYLEKMSQEIAKEISRLQEEVYHLAGGPFNLNSPKQLSDVLFNKLGIKPPKKSLSTSADVLESLVSVTPIAGKILEYRTVEKLRSTYLDSLPHDVHPKTHRVHSTFNQSVAATGRLSSQDPNLQNIPIRSEIGRKIRRAFRPENKGWSYLAADYSQIELRLLADLSGDPELIKAFQHGEDIHASTAAKVLNIPLSKVTPEMRYQAKAVNFGVIYGQQAFGLSQVLGIDIKDASHFIESYFKLYKRVKEYVEESKQNARDTGRAVTRTGRERLIPEIHSKNGQLRAAAERLAINTPLQGSAADLIKLAMLEIDQQIKKNHLKGYMILQIHDELIFEVPDEEIPIFESLVRDTMQGIWKLKVPLVVDVTIGKNWAEC